MATEAEWGDPALSPDGTRIAMDRSNSGGPGDIWVYDTQRGTESRLTFDPKWDYEPVWSADGSRIYFASQRNGTGDLFWRDASGTGGANLLWKDDAAKDPVSVTRDGKYLIAYRTDEQSGLDLWAVPLTGDAKPFPVVQGAYGQARGVVSPDGRWIAYASNESGTRQVYVQPFPKGDGKWQISTQGGTEPQWSANGSELFYVALPNVITAVEVDTRDGFRPGIPRPLFAAPFAVGSDGYRNHYAVHGNGEKFLVIDATRHGMVSPTSIVVNWTAGLARR
jgi:Tol biopolymer transport system component